MGHKRGKVTDDSENIVGGRSVVSTSKGNGRRERERGKELERSRDRKEGASQTVCGTTDRLTQKRLIKKTIRCLSFPSSVL